jgi:hypothetical protein
MWVYDIIHGSRKGHLTDLPPLDKTFSPSDLRQKAVHTWNERGLCALYQPSTPPLTPYSFWSIFAPQDHTALFDLALSWSYSRPHFVGTLPICAADLDVGSNTVCKQRQQVHCCYSAIWDQHCHCHSHHLRRNSSKHVLDGMQHFSSDAMYSCQKLLSATNRIASRSWPGAV